jgi:hypothetical protein
VPGAVSDDRGWRTSHLAAGPGIRIEENGGTQTVSAIAEMGYEPLSGHGIDVNIVGAAVTFDASCLVVGCLGTQNTWAGGQSFSGVFDAGNSTSYRPRTITGVLPATCSVGEVVFKTDATAGQNVYGCTAADTWILQGDAATGSLGSVAGSAGVLASTVGAAVDVHADCGYVGCLGTTNTWSGSQAFSGAFDASTSTSYRPRAVTGALPSTCVVGEALFKTDAPAGQNIYGCTAADTWVLESGGGGTGGGIVSVDGTSGISASTAGGSVTVGINCAYAGCLGTGNTWTAGQSYSGAFDASASTSYKPRTITGPLPANCSIGEFVFKTDETPGQNVYGCTAANTWTLQGDGGTARRTGETYLPALVGSQPTNNFVYNWRIPNTGGAVGWFQNGSPASTFAAMRFVNGQDNTAFLPYFRLPSSWDSTGVLTVILDHKINQTTGGDITLELNIGCLNAGSFVQTPTLHSSGTQIYTVPGSLPFDLDRFSFDLPKTGCSPGSLVNLSITRPGNLASDTYTEDMYLLGAAIQWKEILQ